jgi:4-amino-4-deoxy-L-arabinose transferase-like glycosyltransferase
LTQERTSALGDPALAALLAGWMLLAIASIWLRPLWPVDETRYASVAWEMWLRGDFLVPYINGEPYAHKPPLLFWLIQLGWAVFGVNDWWPRLVGPLCALAAVPLLLRLEGLLWGERQAQRGLSIWVLFGTLLFAGFITLTMFDLLLLLCAMAGMIGVLNLKNERRIPGLLWLGAGIGFGVLAKGPVILLHVLPAAVAAPWWAPEVRGRLARWYLDLLYAVLLGTAIALAWALPAGYAGGEAYRNAIFWGQTAGRVAESFAHRAPWWYYLPLLPLILFPWLAWPRLWRGLKELFQNEKTDPGARFLFAWLTLTVLGFSLVSGKQAKYLVPMLPAFALLAGDALARLRAPARAWELLLPAAGFAALPAALAWMRAHPESLRLPEWAAALPLWPLVALAAAVPALLVFARAEARAQARALAFSVLYAAAVLSAGLLPAFAPYNDPAPVARELAALQARGVPLAHLGKYHATFNFAGRLRVPIEILDPPEVRGWVAAHPGGRVLTVEHRPVPDGASAPELQVRFRGAWVQLWRGEALLVARSELR